MITFMVFLFSSCAIADVPTEEAVDHDMASIIIADEDSQAEQTEAVMDSVDDRLEQNEQLLDSLVTRVGELHGPDAIEDFIKQRKEREIEVQESAKEVEVELKEKLKEAKAKAAVEAEIENSKIDEAATK